ncbi:MAG: SurA N-terminal domain-containing protein [Treponema sp.]|nr:SurA N-terminal domain-containing protein [Treponema sp.]
MVHAGNLYQLDRGMKMKRLIVSTALLLTMMVSVFAASSDMTPLAVIKLNGSETITVKTLKERVNFYLKQTGAKEMSLEQKKAILDSMIYEKLVAQAAAKDGLAITDSQVDQAFLNSMNQQFGQQFGTESQLSDFFKKQTGKDLGAYIKEMTGFSLSDYKAYLKNQILVQQYVYTKKQNEIKKVAATDEEIRNAYAINKSTFVWNDQIKLFLVIVPKDKDAAGAKKKADKMLKDYNKKPASAEETIKTDKDNGKAYQAGYMIMTATQAQQLGWAPEKVVELFGRKKGYISELSETDIDYQFYAVKEKFAAKMLSIDDVIQPESTTTVYDYIKQNLTQQKQSAYFSQAAQDLSKSLDTKGNVDRKKEGSALDKLLNWEAES